MEFLTQHLQALYSLIGYSDMVTQRVSLQKNVAGDGEKALVLLSKPLHYHTRKTKGRDLKSLAGARRQEDRLERERSQIRQMLSIVKRLTAILVQSSSCTWTRTLTMVETEIDWTKGTC